ncbi:MAG: phosphopantetheine-binding protein [Flavobacteriales bacterium]|nr:phosphopantetheine-binding protein [Flavobacteriales bacterium]
MKIEKENISKSVPFAHFGIDSLIVLELLKPFKDTFGYIPTTIFFEHHTVEKLTKYLLEEYTEVCKTFFTDFISTPPAASSKEYEIKSILRKEISQVMKMDPSKLENNIAFKNYGIDSLISLEIIKPLNEIFGYLPTTLLFEHPTLNELAKYISNNTEKWKPLSPIIENVITENTPSLHSENLSRNDDIAIIGFSGRFPKAKDFFEFWENLKTGVNCIEEVPLERWDHSEFYDPDELKENNSSYTKYGGFIEGVDLFDHRFFEITPYDAEKIDPQERLFLEETYKALEDSGYAPSKLKGEDIGVYVGVMNAGYGWLSVDALKPSDADSLYWSIANRTSFFFDWHGPSMAIDTACSSSLTALHTACQALKSGDCSLAIVGGVNLILHPKQYTKLCKMHMLSYGKNCKSFGEGADGFVDGEGIISLVLKPLANALRDNDRVHGVIKSTHINAGGYSNGYTAPNPIAQATLIQRALDKAGVTPSQIGYIEAHGTGTKLGDPLEIRGLEKVFSENNNKCPIGSVKSNIGHLESAAGLAGLTKVLLQLKNEQLVPTLNAEEENQHIDFQKSPFYLNKKLSTWTNNKDLASISSFGAGGANSHVILGKCTPQTLQLSSPTTHFIIPISAKSSSALINKIVNLREAILNNRDNNFDFYSLCYTLACTRDHHAYRCAFVASSLENLINEIDAHLSNIGLNNSKSIEETSTIEEYLSSTQAHKERIAMNLSNQYTNNQDFEWEKIYKTRSIASLNIDPFEKFSHWIEKPRYGVDLEGRYLAQHKIMGNTLLPAAYPLAKASNLLNNGNFLRDIFWLKPIQPGDLHISDDNLSFRDTQNSEYMIANICQTDTSSAPHLRDLLAGKTFNSKIYKKALYSHFKSMGYEYGPLYQRIAFLQSNSETALGLLTSGDLNGDKIEVGILDAALQVAITPSGLSHYKTEGKAFIPFSLNEFRFYSSLKTDTCICFAQVEKASVDEIVTSIYIFDENIKPVATFYKLTSKSVYENFIHLPINDNKSDKNIDFQNKEFKIYKF